MKIHLTWIQATAIRATAAAAMAFAGSEAALAQYAPYGTTGYGAAPQPYSATQPYAAPQQYAPQAYVPQQPAAAPQQYPQTAAYGTPAYNASSVLAQGYSTPITNPAPAYTAQPARPTAYQPTPQPPSYAVRPQQYTQQPPAQQPYAAYPQTAMRPTYPSLAQNNNTPTPATGAAPSSSEALPTPAPINGGNNSGSMNGGNMGGSDMSSMSNAQAAQGYDMGYQNSGAACGCGAGGYPTTGACGASSCGCGQQDYGISSYFNQGCSGRQWFGGVYYLFMDRTNPSDSRLAVRFDTVGPTYPYYPQSQTTILRTSDAEDGFRSGGEIRFGSTFGIGSACDTCDSGCGGYGGCNSGCGCNACENQQYAWEAAWWALDKDVTTASYTDQAPGDQIQIFGMKNFAGVLYDRTGGNTYAPLNNYTNYSDPVPAVPNTPPVDGDIRTVSVSVRTSFALDNIELNFLRLPMMCGCSAPACNSGCGYGDCGGYGGCNSGCGCEQPCCGSAFTMTGLCGIRFLRIDDDFRFGDSYRFYDSVNGNTDATLNFDRSVDNLLTGFQWGENMNYCIACRWNIFLDSTFGVFDNHMNVYQHFSDNIGGNFAVPTYRSSKDDVAFLGELRIGGSYDISCHWRAVLAYRAVGITGIASSTDLPDFTDVSDAQHINSDRSVVIHGVQAGVECRY